MSAPQTPREVLDAVRRLEDELESVRAGARARERELEDLRAGIAQDSARERRALVEDLERLVELVGAGWRSTGERIDALTAEVAEVRRVAEDAAGALLGGRLELRLEGPSARNGSGPPGRVPRPPADAG